MKILLLEDDPVLSDLIIDYIESDHTIDGAYSIDSALQYIDTKQFDLYIFDINVPGGSGLGLLRQLREAGDQTPVIMLTAYQDIQHLRDGFDYGCNDYLRKPFELEELSIRIQSIQKQYHPNNFITIDATITLDVPTNTVTNNGKNYVITAKEKEILLYMMAHSRRLISTEELVSNIWESDHIPSDTTLRGYIKNLREALGKERIQTIRGEGYFYHAS